MSKNNLTPDKKLAAVCGLFCPACSLYIGSHEDPMRLENMSKRMNYPINALQCNGCRSDKRCFFCENMCKMTNCASKKGIDFCGECDEYPCEELKMFQSQMPHRTELWDSLESIKKRGYEEWFLEMIKHYSCEECGTINSAYDIKCRKCGHEPGNDFIYNHKNKIVRHLEKLK